MRPNPTPLLLPDQAINELLPCSLNLASAWFNKGQINVHGCSTDVWNNKNVYCVFISPIVWTDKWRETQNLVMCVLSYITLSDIDVQNALLLGFPGNSRCTRVCLCTSAWMCAFSKCGSVGCQLPQVKWGFAGDNWESAVISGRPLFLKWAETEPKPTN